MCLFRCIRLDYDIWIVFPCHVQLYIRYSKNDDESDLSSSYAYNDLQIFITLYYRLYYYHTTRPCLIYFINKNIYRS